MTDHSPRDLPRYYRPGKPLRLTALIADIHTGTPPDTAILHRLSLYLLRQVQKNQLHTAYEGRYYSELSPTEQARVNRLKDSITQIDREIEAIGLPPEVDPNLLEQIGDNLAHNAMYGNYHQMS